jgi:hypothetical protein
VEKLDYTLWHKWNANNGFIESNKETLSLCQIILSHAFAKVDAEDLTEIEEGSNKDQVEDDATEPTKQS